MANSVRILGFAGSLRVDSWNKKLLKIALTGAEEAGVSTTFLDLRDFPLPVYDEDIERASGLPASALALKEQFKSHQGLLLACPEYNSSITAALKNAIDWVSRPAPGEKPLECFNGKVAGLIAASPGALGGLRGLVTVRSILSNINVIVLPNQFALVKAHECFNADGTLKDAGQTTSVKNIGAALAKVVGKLNG